MTSCLGTTRPKFFAALPFVRKWHIRDIARSQIEVRFRCKKVRFRCKSGHTAAITAMTGFDPQRS